MPQLKAVSLFVSEFRSKVVTVSTVPIPLSELRWIGGGWENIDRLLRGLSPKALCREMNGPAKREALIFTEHLVFGREACCLSEGSLWRDERLREKWRRCSHPRGNRRFSCRNLPDERSARQELRPRQMRSLLIEFGRYKLLNR